MKILTDCRAAVQVAENKHAPYIIAHFFDNAYNTIPNPHDNMLFNWFIYPRRPTLTVALTNSALAQYNHVVGYDYTIEEQRDIVAFEVMNTPLLQSATSCEITWVKHHN